MSKTVTIHEAKAQLSRLIAQVCLGEEIIITSGGEPVARLVPLANKKGSRKPGALKGKLIVGPEFFQSLRPEELEDWKS